MLAEERYRKIMELLRRNQTVKVAALAERFTYDEFTKIIQYPQNGFGDMRMVNRAFIAHGYKDIAPTKGVDYFQNYWEERIARGDGKLRALLLSRL